MKKLMMILCILPGSMQIMRAQSPAKPDRELKMNLNDDGSHYLKATFTAQLWARYNQSNPGTTLFGENAPETFDLGIRRARTQVFGKIHDKVFLYTQFGINNFNTNAARKPGIFFHDIVAEYQLTPRSLQLGMGLSSWTGPARFSSPAVASILGVDAPLYQQTTNDATDQFLRKFSIYGKGKISKLDYRLVLTTPMAAQQAGTSVVKTINVNSDFSYKPAKLQSSGYFMWQFLDEESNLTPYMAGSYLGKKHVFNIGLGYQYQPNAMWHYTDTAVSSRKVVEEDMLHLNADVFYDAPLGQKGAAISAYAAFSKLNYGKNYMRNLGPMNPADAASSKSLGGGGTAIPMYGTGNVFYAQTAVILPNNLVPEKYGKVQPYLMYMHANYERLKDPMQVFDAGLNYLIDGNRAKLTLDYQNRPVFNPADAKQNGRRNAVILQFQIAI